VRAIELESETGGDDSFVLGLHGAGQRVEVGLVRGVVVVGDEAGDLAGAGGGDEYAGWLAALERGFQAAQVALDRVGVLELDRANAQRQRGTVAAALGPAGSEAGEVVAVAAGHVLALAAEAFEPFGHIGGIGNL